MSKRVVEMRSPQIAAWMSLAYALLVMMFDIVARIVLHAGRRSLHGEIYTQSMAM